jgi:pseudouridine synthase
MYAMSLKLMNDKEELSRREPHNTVAFYAPPPTFYSFYVLSSPLLATMVWLSKAVAVTTTGARRTIWSCSYRHSVVTKNCFAPRATDSRGVAGPSETNFHWPQLCPRKQFASSSASTSANSEGSSSSSIRLSKLLSKYASNLTLSRREAERLIRQGQVTLAGRVVDTPHLLVEWKDISAHASNAKIAPLSVLIKVQGKAAQIWAPEQVNNTKDDDDDATDDNQNAVTKTDKPKVWIVHKLGGEVVTERDPLNRPSLLERLKRGGVGFGSSGTGGKKIRYHLKPIGRLDVPTEGLLLLTNDGDYAREMELPKSKLHRTYRVRAHGQLTPYKLDCIRRGTVYHENVRYGPMSVFVERIKRGSRTVTSTNTWLRVTCTEGKNRQIRNVFQALGCKYRLGGCLGGNVVAHGCSSGSRNSPFHSTIYLVIRLVCSLLV